MRGRLAASLHYRILFTGLNTQQHTSGVKGIDTVSSKNFGEQGQGSNLIFGSLTLRVSRHIFY